MPKQFIPILLSLVALTAASRLNSVEFSNLFKSSSTFNTSTTCNEVLNGTSGTISYKTNQSLIANERCVWTIRSPNATSYSFGIFEMGFPEPSGDHQITVSGITRDSQIVQVIPTQPGIYNVENANILVIVFHTGASIKLNTFTGFSLQFLSISDGTNIPVISSRSKDVIRNTRMIGDYGRYDYPDGYYAPNELATIVLSSYGNVYNRSEETGMIYWGRFENGGCGDHTDMYFFNPNTPAGWELHMQLCGDEEGSFQLFPHRDMMLAVFQTNNNTEVNFGNTFISPGYCY